MADMRIVKTEMGPIFLQPIKALAREEGEPISETLRTLIEFGLEHFQPQKLRPVPSRKTVCFKVDLDTHREIRLMADRGEMKMSVAVRMLLMRGLIEAKS